MKKLIRHNFSRAAQTYDQHGQTQLKVATDFAHRLSQLDSPSSILEIGCGTGFLSQYLTHYKCPLILGDLSPNMLQTIPPLDALKVVFDGEQLPFNTHFDWIVSSLALQWFDTPHTSIHRLKDHCKTLAFTTLGDRNFQEWADFCHLYGIEASANPMLSVADLKQILGSQTQIIETLYTEHHPNWLSFWDGIHKIGANTQIRQKKAPLPKSLLKREPISCSYHVLTVISR